MPEKKNNLTRAALSKAVHLKLGFTLSEANGLVDQVLDEITNAMVGATREGKAVKIPDFGTFTAKMRDRRIGRNLHTGAEVAIEPQVGVSFKAAPKFRATIDEQLKNTKGIPKT